MDPGWSSVSYDKEAIKEALKPPFLSCFQFKGGLLSFPVPVLQIFKQIWRIGRALIMATTQIIPGHVSQLGNFLSKMDCWNVGRCQATVVSRPLTLAGFFERAQKDETVKVIGNMMGVY